VAGRTSFDDELYSFERWRSEQGLRSAGLDTRSFPEAIGREERRLPLAPPPANAQRLRPENPSMENSVTENSVTDDSVTEDFATQHFARERFATEDSPARLEPADDPPTKADVADVARVPDGEARLRREWEALRDLYEQPLRRLQDRYLPALENYTRAMAEHRRQLAQAQARIETLEERVSREFATAATHLHEVATIIRDLTAIRDRAADAVPDAAPIQEALPSVAAASRRMSTAMLSLGAVVAIAIAAAAAGVLLNARVRDLAARTAATEAAVSSAASRVERVTNVLVAPDVRSFQLTPGPAAPDAYGQALWSATRGVVLAAVSLPPVREGETYEAWLLTDAGSWRLGPVSPDASGRLTATFNPGAASGDVKGALVTVESGSGGQTPTGPIALTP
jgi:hypothetical protein